MPAPRQGLTVRARAPTGTAADVLGRATGAEPETVASMLGQQHGPCELSSQVWIVDKASMLSARDAERLIARAPNSKARLILVGDVAQLGSVEAGCAFGQFRKADMETAVLDKIVRQSNLHTRKAVEAMLAGDAAAAFDALDAGGGAIVEHAEDDIRHALVARDFAKLSPEARAATPVLDPNREGRQRLTESIRFALVRDGTLGQKAMVATVLEPVGLTRAGRAIPAAINSGRSSPSAKVPASGNRPPALATALIPWTPRAAPCGCSAPRTNRSPGRLLCQAAIRPRRSSRWPRSSARGPRPVHPQQLCRQAHQRP